MEPISLRIDQLKNQQIAIICTDRTDLDFMVSLLGYDPKIFASITSFPIAISAKSGRCTISLSQNEYIFVSAMAVKFANTTEAKTVLDTPPKGIVVNCSAANPAIMTALIQDLKSLGMNIPTDNENGDIKTIFSHMSSCTNLSSYKIFNAYHSTYDYPTGGKLKFVIPEDYNKVIDHVKSAIAYYEKKEQVQKVVVIGNGKYSVIVQKNGVLADNKTISITTIQDLVNKLTNHTFPWTVTIDSISIGCYKNITIKDLVMIIETYNELQKK